MADQYKCDDCGDIAIRNHHTCLGPREAYSCECDPEVGFFCAHCANENNYIQYLQNQIVILQDRVSKSIHILEENEAGWVCEECNSFDIAQNALQVLRRDLE